MKETSSKFGFWSKIGLLMYFLIDLKSCEPLAKPNWQKPGLAEPRQVARPVRGGGGRDGRIGADLTKIDFLMKNVVLSHF